MHNELRNQILVAASIIKSNGFEYTFEELINIVRLKDFAVVTLGPN